MDHPILALKPNVNFYLMLDFTNLIYELKALDTFSGMYFQNKLHYVLKSYTPK